MKLFRVEQTGFGVQSLRVFGNNLPQNQGFDVVVGNYLLTTDMMKDFADNPLSPPRGQGAKPLRASRHSKEILDLMSGQD